MFCRMYDRPDPGLKIKVKTNRDPDSADVTEVKRICSRGGAGTKKDVI